MTKKIIPEIASPLLILLFAYAAMNKLLIYHKFVSQIAASPVLKGLAPYLAWAIPVVELIVCILLIVPKWRLIGFYAATFLMAAFTVYIIALFSFSTKLPCSCGGILDRMDWKTHLVFNIIYTGIAITGLVFEKRFRTHVERGDMSNQLNYQV
jgi:uncharacterized membrane protein YphA (DoxX/SURF4 family)